MEFLIPSVKVIHIFVSIFLVLIILLQPSKSGDIGSMFGGGTSESLFGSSGAMPFLVKLTRLFGLIFVITSLFLGYASIKSMSGSVIEDQQTQTIEEFEEVTEEVTPEQTDSVEQAEPSERMQMEAKENAKPIEQMQSIDSEQEPEK